jgi:DNA-directed RNA polymerase specialized sigma subunit
VLEAVRSLSDVRQRRLIERHYVDDCELTVVAQELGLSYSAVGRLHGRAIRALERVLRGTKADPRSSNDLWST